jgi:FMN-dependent NADH-azoreductase
MGHRFLSVIMSFFGVPSFEGLFIEGHNAMPEIKLKKLKKMVLLVPKT